MIYDQLPDTNPIRPQTELDTALGGSIQNEDEAWENYNALKAERKTPGTIPADRLPAMRTQLSSYVKQARAYNRPLFSSQTNDFRIKQNAHTNALLEGTDDENLKKALAPEQFTALANRAKLAPDPDAYKARAINAQILATAYGSPIKPDMLDTARNHYAKTVLKMSGDTSDKAVYGELQKRKGTMKFADELVSKASEQYFQDTAAGSVKPFEEYTAPLAAIPDDDLREQATNELRLTRRRISSLNQSVGPIASALFNYVTSDAGRADAVQIDTAANPITSEIDAANRFMKLSSEQQAAVMGIIAARSKNMPPDPRTGVQRAGSAMGEQTTDMLKGFSNFYHGVDAQLTARLETLLEKATGEYEKPGSMSPAPERSILRKAIDLTGLNDPMTEREHNFDQLIRARTSIKNMGQAAKNPVKPSDSWALKSFILGAQTLPYMVTASSGVGSALTAASMAGDSYANARTQNPEANPRRQLEMATVSGAAQAVIERASVKSFTSAIKGNNTLIKFLTGKYGAESALRLAGVTSALGRGAAAGLAGVAVTTAVEYSEEMAQDFTDRGLQDLAIVFSDQDPTTDYGALLQSWKPTGKQGSDTILALLPYALIGGAGASFSHFRNGTQLQHNAAALRAVGVKEEAIQKILRSPDIQTADQQMKEAFDAGLEIKGREEMDVYQEAMRVHMNHVQALSEATGTKLLTKLDDPESPTGESYELRLPGKETQFYDNEQDAHNAFADYYEEERRTDQSEIEQGLVNGIIGMMKEDYQANQNVVVRKKDMIGSMSNMIKSGAITLQEATARLEIYALEQGMTMPELQKEIALGNGPVVKARAFAEQVNMKSRRYIVELFNGADPLNATEDFSESYWQKALYEGLINANHAVGWLMDLGKATGYQYLPTAFDYAPAMEDSASLTPEQNEARRKNARDAAHMQLVEGLSKASVQYMLGNLDHQNIPTGLRGWIERMAAIAGKAWTWARQLIASKEMKAAIADGKVRKEFVTHLADSVGLNESMREQRAMQEQTEEHMAAFVDENYKLSEVVKGKLLHPDTARATDNPAAGELQNIYDGLLSYAKKKNKSGTFTTFAIKATQFFAPKGEMVKLDDLRGNLEELGFTGMDTVSDMLDKINDVISTEGMEYYATNAGINQSFSLGRATITPEANTRIFEGAAGSPTVIGPVSFSLSAYHGTPHKVDRFSLDKIGTGEGAQAYGWGLYFAASKEVAEDYRIKLAYDPDKMKINGRQINAEYSRMEKQSNTAKDSSWIYSVIEGLERLMMHESVQWVIDYAKENEWDQRAIDYFANAKFETFGHLYTVTLDVNDDELLDWDKPLSEQSAKIQSLFPDYFIKQWTNDTGYLSGNISPEGILQGENQRAMTPAELEKNGFIYDTPANYITGSGIYSDIIQYQGRADWTQRARSEKLASLGIPGIRFLDGNSRDGGKGTYNYVMFDDSKITITEENGNVVDIKENVSFSLSNPLDNSSNSNQHINHANRSRLSDPTSTTRPPGKGERRSPEELRELITRAAKAGSERRIAKGSESSVIQINENAVLKTILPKGIWAYNTSGKLIRTNDAALLADKIESIRALDGLQTDSFEYEGSLYIYQELGTPISDDDFAALELPFNIKPALGNTYRIDVNGRTFLVSDLHKDNFLKDSKGVIRVADLIASEVEAQATPLAGMDATSFSLSRPQTGALEEIIAARMNAGPDERAKIYENMRTRLLAHLYKLERRTATDLSDIEEALYGWKTNPDMTDAERERLRIEDALDAVKALVSAAPVEIRAEITVPLTRILNANTERKTVNAFAELIENIDEVIEKHLRKEYREAIENILEMSTPAMNESRQRKGKLTPETQILIDQIEAVTYLNADEILIAQSGINGNITSLTEQIDEAKTDEQRDQLQAKLAELTTQAKFLHYFGLMEDADTKTLAQAKETITSIYKTGRYARKLIDADDKAESARNRKDVLMSLDASYGVSQAEFSNATDKKNIALAKEITKNVGFNLFDIHTLLETVFPHSKFTAKISRDLIKAMRGTYRRRRAVHEKFEKFLVSLGYTTKRKQNAFLASISERKSLPVEIAEPVENGWKTEQISIEMAEKIIAGTIKIDWYNYNNEDNRLASDDLVNRLNQWRQLPRRRKSAQKFIKLTRVTGRKKAEALHMSQTEIIYWLQLAAQSEYGSVMNNHGITPAVVEKLKAELTPDTAAIMRFMRESYDENHGDMNEVFMDLYNMPMPHIRNYAPGLFDSKKNATNTSGDPMGSDTPMSAMNIGATKQRQAHNARPRQVSALNVFFGHHDKATYWMEYATIARDLRMILMSPNVRRAIEAKQGTGIKDQIAGWIDAIDKDGANDMTVRLETDKIMQSFITAASTSALTWNFSVPFKQLSAAFGSMWFIRPSRALPAFFKALSSPATMRKVWKSEAIQSRIYDGFSPEDRELLRSNGLTGKQIFRDLSALNRVGRLPMSYADAFFTTISGAIAYEYHYAEARKAKSSPMQADAQALSFMDMVVARSSQPNNTQFKSLLEINAKGVSKLAYMYKSDPRKQLALLISHAYLAAKGKYSKAQLAEEFAVQWIAYGLVFQLGSSVFQSFVRPNSPDNDDLDEIWNWKNFVAAAAAGPIEGIAIIGGAINAEIKRLAGQKNYTTSVNPLNDVAAKVIGKFHGQNTFFDTQTNLVLASMVAAPFDKGHVFSALPAAWKGVSQIAKFLDGIHTSDAEEIENANDAIKATVKESLTVETQNYTTIADDIEAMPPNEQKAAMDALDKEAKAKVTSILKKREADSLDMTPTEKEIFRLGKTSRAERINAIVQKLSPDAAEEFKLRMRELNLME